MEVAIECDGLTKVFPNVKAVDGLTLSVNQGEVFGLVGPDGAGKTTTIRMLCGIMESTSGSISVLGGKIPDQINELVSNIGYMSQRFSLYGDLTVDENIDFFADLFQVEHRERTERVERLLHASRMEQFRKRLAQDLSGGMKQKLALVCTLIHTPKVLFLDEPTTGVDPISRREFWQILYGLVAEGMTLMVSTPYMDEADRCQRLALMDKGKLLLCDTPANIRRSMKSTVVEAQTAEPQKARALLSTTPGVLGVEAFGERLHATVATPAEVPKIEAALKAAGIEITELRVIAPSLEDAFISYLEAEEAVG